MYSKEELRSTLALVDAGNKETGGLRQTARGTPSLHIMCRYGSTRYLCMGIYRYSMPPSVSRTLVHRA